MKSVLLLTDDTDGRYANQFQHISSQTRVIPVFTDDCSVNSGELDRRLSALFCLRPAAAAELVDYNCSNKTGNIEYVGIIVSSQRAVRSLEHSWRRTINRAAIITTTTTTTTTNVEGNIGPTIQWFAVGPQTAAALEQTCLFIHHKLIEQQQQQHSQNQSKLMIIQAKDMRGLIPLIKQWQNTSQTTKHQLLYLTGDKCRIEELVDGLLDGDRRVIDHLQVYETRVRAEELAHELREYLQTITNTGSDGEPLLLIVGLFSPSGVDATFGLLFDELMSCDRGGDSAGSGGDVVILFACIGNTTGTHLTSLLSDARIHSRISCKVVIASSPTPQGMYQAVVNALPL